MAAALTATYDKTSYNIGDVATLTLVRPMGQLSVTVDAPGLPEIVATAPYSLPLTLVANDGHTYVKASDDGSKATYTTTV